MTRREPIAERLLAGIVLFLLIAVVLGVLVQFHVLPAEVWFLVVGPGFLIASLLVPGGLHSDSVGLFVIAIVIGSVGWWWFVFKIALEMKRRYWRRPT